MKAKIIMLSALGVASFGLTQAASAWTSGDCSATSTRPCIEHSDGYYFTNTGVWEGDPTTGAPFTFSGSTVLTCGSNVVDCTLSLEGKARIEMDGSTPKVGIEVSNGSVTGGFLCGFVNVGGFPWYIDENNEHGPYSNAASVGIPYNAGSTPPINFIGSIGTIDVSVPLLGINVTDGHMHDVTYNNSDTFSFGTGSLDPNIYDQNENATGCTVSGDLQLQPSGDTLTIF
ncbi:hypothetical protein ACEK07_32660 [Alcanivoracaceae bacterium MT1]